MNFSQNLLVSLQFHAWSTEFFSISWLLSRISLQFHKFYFDFMTALPIFITTSCLLNRIFFDFMTAQPNFITISWISFQFHDCSTDFHYNFMPAQPNFITISLQLHACHFDFMSAIKTIIKHGNTFYLFLFIWKYYFEFCTKFQMHDKYSRRGPNIWRQ
jgi:hypothetical protein